MKKQGFTLIELMVVIVIMGILAAVAVPKLFGMIAKSKASEVGPAAGTYLKLQDAYVSESNKIGNWTLIGYVAPGASSAGSPRWGHWASPFPNGACRSAWNSTPQTGWRCRGRGRSRCRRPNRRCRASRDAGALRHRPEAPCPALPEARLHCGRSRARGKGGGVSGAPSLPRSQGTSLRRPGRDRRWGWRARNPATRSLRSGRRRRRTPRRRPVPPSCVSC